MAGCVRGSCILLQFMLIGMVMADPLGSSKCPSSQDFVLPCQDTCMAADIRPHGNRSFDSSRVTELDEVSLERALDIVKTDIGTYMAVLFYASWCPFSKACRPVFDVLSSMFPSIHHVAVEESALRPRYGVHSFPSLFLQNQTSRMRYHGLRQLESLVDFYKNITGMEPVSPDFLAQGMSSRLSGLGMSKSIESGEHCPYSWAKSPEKILQQDTYLILAILFLVLRMLHFLFPKILLWVKQLWKRHVWPVNVAIVRENPPTFLEQILFIFNLNRIRSSLKFCKTGNFQEGAMNARAWASTSLASVSLGEGSSSKAGSFSEAH
eukprot:Gb_37627 [translate_table: standard]